MSCEKAFIIPPELDWETIEEKHQIVDRLSQTTSKNRNPQDTIVDTVFDCLKDKLDGCQSISNYVNKFVAHSATPESRCTIDDFQFQISLRDIWGAHKIIYEVANFLSGILFSVDHMVLPVEGPNFFDFWDEPIIPTEGFDRIHDVLIEYGRETEAWRDSSSINIWEDIEDQK